jgi:hypothetical protein
MKQYEADLKTYQEAAKAGAKPKPATKKTGNKASTPKG